ncbi:MAG: PrsW family glutamic-type intramembrane protease [Opitutales bacterium]|jgi:protease PrsW
MTLVLLAVAIAPGLAIAIYIYWRDEHEKEPIGLLVKCFALGALMVFPAIFIEGFAIYLFDFDNSLPQAFLKAFLCIGLTEEALKYLILTKYAYSKPAFNEPFDGIVYSVIIGLGFATMENIFYVYEYGAKVGFIRMFTAVPMHAAFGVLMGYYVGLAKFQTSSLRVNSKIKGLCFAILFHGAYDFFLIQDDVPFLVLLNVVVIFYAIRLSRKAIQAHLNVSPFKK